MDTLISSLIGVVAGFAIVQGGRWVFDKLAEERSERRPSRLSAGISNDSAPDHMKSKTFTVRDALNGQYITFHKYQYNPNGPDTNEQCVYIVKDDEALIDAISVVLVLMDKED